ncbi:hypothetical protein, partial [Lactococcus lactis]|uniref:hypothetical protein n=1 Tax=Lactococcus lactis TaxID=1358 RepID=UPI00289193E1
FFFWSRKKTFYIKGLKGAILVLTNDLLGGVVVPPHFPKFQKFFEFFPALPLGKISCKLIK